MTADPKDPQPGDRFTYGPAVGEQTFDVIALHNGWAWVEYSGEVAPRMVLVRWIGESCRPVLTPLITEPVTLHHRVTPGGGWALGLNDDSPWITLTGRKIEMRPDGTWTEIPS
jgi:hypothetical protein